MSASWAAIKFKRTGNIYLGCYEGTSDTMNPIICTPEECYDEKLDCYCSIQYCRERSLTRHHWCWKLPEGVEDLDEVEIYSDYGGGFWWYGVGSENLRLIESPIDEFGCVDFDKIIDGKPKWVEIFEAGLGGDEL